MKQIPLTQGQFALVDDEDFGRLSQFKWYAWKHGNTYYAVRNGGKNENQNRFYIHRVIMKAQKGQQIDHCNHSGLDNRRKNMRFCNNTENNRNELPTKNASSQWKGVSWHKLTQKWKTTISYNYKSIHLGYFNDEVEAAKAYDKKAKELFEEFACLNFGERRLA